jgi:hypothetical protein
MTCPICNQTVAFSLPMHMHAVHGPNGPMVKEQESTPNTRTVNNHQRKPQGRSWAKPRRNRQSSGRAY